ncbi:hypothetical protein QBC44DRAFT_317159 [Cladorrhinum sp. PSN332]|nr:hypothetical protein QBC44DRAFT_317159 [Cladorrhinum sp. PSN332]
MAGPNPDAFERARLKFQQSIGSPLAQQFSLCTLQDVRDTIRDIQAEHGRENKLRNMRRLSAFVEAIEQFGKVVDVFLNASEFVCFVWGPIKFLLGIAKAYVDSFDKLLDAYSDIGNAIPGLMHYKATFEKHPPLATVLEDYYSDILEFHAKAIAVFKRNRWKKLFHSTWKTFDSEFSPILHSLTRRRDLLDGEKSSATLYEIERVREDIDAMRTTQRQQLEAENLARHKIRLGHVKEKLQFANYQLDQEVSTEDRNGSNSGQWIFEDPEFLAWKNIEQGGNRVLFINGKPGAGKTTLVSAIIERLLAEKSSNHRGQSAVAYFYFKDGQEDKNTFNAMLRALLEQLIGQDQAASIYFHELVSSTSGVNLRATKTLQDFVMKSVQGYQASYLVLDGLDECANGEASKIIDCFLSLVSPQPQSTDAGTKLRVILAGQRDGVLDTRLASHPSISLDHAGHLNDIRFYTEAFGEKIQAKFKLSADMKQEIVSLVLTEADGMFLFARVVLDNLLRQTRLSRLKQEIQPGVFPKGLEKAYDRVATRVLDQSSESESKDALKVLSLVACAKRMLFWREIQAFFCIDPAQAQVNYEDCLLVTCKELCGSLLDTHHVAGGTAGSEREDMIQMVHETARLYLLRNRLDQLQEDIWLSKFCIQYLASTPFEAGSSTQIIEKYASQGYYALQEYCLQHWFHHLRQCVQTTLDSAPEQLDELIHLAQSFMISCLAPESSGQFQLNDIDNARQTIKTLPVDLRALDGLFHLISLTTRIRDVIEQLNSRPSDSFVNAATQNCFAILQARNDTFKCHKPWCDFFTSGFSTRQERYQHMLSHDLPYYCHVEGCFAQSLGFESQGRLSEHEKLYHPSIDNDVKFPTLGTKKPLTLCSAVEKGDLSAVMDLLDAGADIDSPDRPNGGFTPLILAAKSGHVEIAKTLVSRGADVNFKGPKRNMHKSALWHAAESNNLEMFAMIIEATITQQIPHINLPLVVFSRISKGRIDVLRSPLFPWDQIEVKFKWSILKSACRFANVEMVRHLMQVGFDDSIDTESVREVVMTYNGSETQRLVILRLLLQTGNPEVEDEPRWLTIPTGPVLHRAIRGGDPGMAEELLRYPKLLHDWGRLKDYRTQAGKKNWHGVVGIVDNLIRLKEKAEHMANRFDTSVSRGEATCPIALATSRVIHQNPSMSSILDCIKSIGSIVKPMSKVQVEQFVALVDEAKRTVDEWKDEETGAFMALIEQRKGGA